MNKKNLINTRKDDHLLINQSKDVYSSNTTGLDRLRFIHNAMPEMNFQKIDLSTSFLGKSLDFPLLVSSMTGGTTQSVLINRRLAEAAQHHQIAMGVGSQRIGLEQAKLMENFNVRKWAPDILLFANLGAVQLNYGFCMDDCKRAVESIQANALILHLNPLQEALMHEGDTNFSNLLGKIEKMNSALNVPLVIKEVGWGISAGIAKKLFDVGISIIDVSGAGGTSWSEVEKFRAKDEIHKQVAASFHGWGIPTATAIKEIRKQIPGITLIASGGLRNGIDIAKCIALGAKLTGMAGNLLRAASVSEKELDQYLTILKTQLKTVMFVCGAKNVPALMKMTLIEK